MRAFILGAALPLLLPAFAQTKTDRAEVNWGPELNDHETGEFNRLFGQNDDAVFMTMTTKRALLIQKMNGDLASLYNKPLDLERDKKDMTLEDLVLVDDRIIVFASFYDRHEDNNTLYMRVFDQATMAPQDGWERLAQFGSEKRFNGGFGVQLSPDSRKVLVYVALPFEKGQKPKFQLKVFNSALELQWEREVQLPYDGEEFLFEGYRVDNAGDVVLIGVKYAERSEARQLKRAGKTYYEYHLITYSGDNNDHDHPIAVSDKFLQDMTISLDKDSGDILCAGFFGKKGESTVRGTFFLKLDPRTKEITHQSFKEFSDDFITQYMTEKEEKKARKQAAKKDDDLELYEYDLDEIVRRDDGGAVLVGEQYYTYTTSSSYTDANGYMHTRTDYHYIYNDIIVVNIDPDGTVAWATKVPKRQHTTNDGGYFSSYALAVKGDLLYFVYNDNGKNLFLEPGDKFEWTDFAGKQSIVTLATVKGDGTVIREALFDPEKRDLILRPKSSAQLKDDRLFLFAERGKAYRFGMVTFR